MVKATALFLFILTLSGCISHRIVAKNCRVLYPDRGDPSESYFYECERL
jgi:hypothetical protein